MKSSKAILVALAIFCILIQPISVNAISKNDLKHINQDTTQYDESCTGGSGASITGGEADLVKFLQALAKQESGGNPNQPGSAGGARGKYQYIDSTWEASSNSYYPPAFQKYPMAHLAPETTQDAVAYIEYAVKFKKLDNDLFKLAISHFYPVANEDPSKLDIIPPSNVITPRQYANKLINGIKNGSGKEIKIRPQEAPEFEKYLNKAGVGFSDDNGGTSNNNSEKKVTLIGDSIMVGARDNGNLKQKLDGKGWESTIDASGARSIATAGLNGPRTTGLQAVEDNKDKIKESSVVVIQLGTNRSNSVSQYRQLAKEMIRDVRRINKDTKIIWVNIFSKGIVSAYREDYNSVLEELARSEKITILDTTDTNIPLQSDQIHPSWEGYKKFADLLVEGITKIDSSQVSSTDECGNSNNSSSAGKGSIESIEGSRQELNRRLLENPKLDTSYSASIRSDITNGEVSDDLVKLMIAIMEQGNFKLKITSLKSNHFVDGINGHNPGGVAVDIGYYASDPYGQKLYRWLYKHYKSLKIRQMIFDLPPDKLPCIGQNAANTSSGPVGCASFYQGDLRGHNNHIHVGVFR